jgi:cell fate regulator YaaT (PSP1 superfamily)
MQKFLVSVYPWESPRLFESNLNIAKGEKVIVPSEYANELGIVKSDPLETKEEPGNKIFRIATERDRQAYNKYEEQRKDLIELCRTKAKELGLEMKVVDAQMSLDGRQTIFAFTADGRVDFRELVKNISAELKKTIRMQQIGSRDEARKLGGYGICGRELCCANFQGSIQSVTTDMARIQQISHRGAERISGLCGRLMCCLHYEAEQYREMLKGMPEMYSIIDSKEGKGTVVEINAVKQEVKVKLENGKYLSIKKEDLK